MTEKERELALYCLKASSDYHSEVCEECKNYPNCDHTIQDDVTETIIKALEQEPTVQDKQAESEKYQKAYDDGYADGYAQARFDFEPKTGHWITWKEAGNDIPSETRFECSVCHDAAQTLCNGLDLLSPFCPNCGAKMEESQKSEVSEYGSN